MSNQHLPYGYWDVSGLHAKIAALESQLAALGWQPGETAPRDGSTIQGSWLDGPPMSAYHKHNKWWTYQAGMLIELVDDPIFWRPIPPLPKEVEHGE